jgi:hypothetical protein
VKLTHLAIRQASITHLAIRAKHARNPCPGFHNFSSELIVWCKNSPQTGGAIYVDVGGTCNIDGGTFLSNNAGYVSQQRKKPSLTSPFARKMLEIPVRDSD